MKRTPHWIKHVHLFDGPDYDDLKRRDYRFETRTEKGSIFMRTIAKIWNGTSLIVKILIGLVLGAALGLLAPQATFFTILGDLFVGALKGIAPLLVFVLVVSSLANAAGE